MALTEDYQFEYTVEYSGGNSSTLTFGGTSLATPGIDVISVDGLFDTDVRVGDRPFTRQHGDVPGEHWISYKDIVLRLGVRGDPSTQGYWDLVESVVHEHFLARPEHKDAEQLSFRMPGFNDRFVRARTIKRTYPRRADTEWGYFEFTVMMRANDPRIYELAETNSGSQSGTFNVTNSGKANVYPILEISQSGTAVLTNNTFPQTMTIGPGVTAGTLVCDFDTYIRGKKGLVVYVGSTNHYGEWNHPRQPFVLGPGTNSLTLTTGSSVVVKHRNTWL